MDFAKRYAVVSSKISVFFASKIGLAYGYLMLSWLYAACSQIIIPLPFNLVPLSIQPAPLFIAAWLLGRHAVYAYGFYLTQGALGLPFFAGHQGGLLRLMGPTGGYLLGFGVAMMLVAATRHWCGRSVILRAVQLVTAHATAFAFGLAQLAWFVPTHKLLAAGLCPFLVGDFIIKISFGLLVLRILKSK